VDANNRAERTPRLAGIQVDWSISVRHGLLNRVGEIVVDYQITPSQKPLSGDPTADLRYCTGQY